MEDTVFTQPEVSGELVKVVEAWLHTDAPTRFKPQILELQQRFAGTLALPVYVILDPKSETTLGIKYGGNPFKPMVFRDFVAKTLPHTAKPPAPAQK